MAYASAELGDDLSSVCGGILYVCFALTAFLVSNPLVIAIGWKNGLMIGTFGYCVYVCGFLMSVIFLEYAFTLSWIIACSAAAVGGLAGGLLWTAQVLALQSEIVLCFPSDCLIREGVSANTRRSIPQPPDCQSIKSPPISLHCLRHIFSASAS